MTRPGPARPLANGERRKLRIKRRSPSPMIFTDELLADIQRRYEQTPEVLATMAFDLDIARSTFAEMAKQKGWVRYRQPPHDLDAAARLSARAQALTKAVVGNDAVTPAPATAPPEGAGHDADEEPQDMAALILWLQREVQAQTALVKQLREQQRAEPLTDEAAIKLARILSSLTDAATRLDRHTRGFVHEPADPEDFPENIDELRLELARRIEAFVKSRTDLADGDDAVAAAGDVVPG